MHFVPCVIVKKNNPLEFTIEVYTNLLHGQHFLIDISYLQAQMIIFNLLVNGEWDQYLDFSICIIPYYLMCRCTFMGFMGNWILSILVLDWGWGLVHPIWRCKHYTCHKYLVNYIWHIDGEIFYVIYVNILFVTCSHLCHYILMLFYQWLLFSKEKYLYLVFQILRSKYTFVMLNYCEIVLQAMSSIALYYYAV